VMFSCCCSDAILSSGFTCARRQARRRTRTKFRCRDRGQSSARSECSAAQRSTMRTAPPNSAGDAGDSRRRRAQRQSTTDLDGEQVGVVAHSDHAGLGRARTCVHAGRKQCRERIDRQQRQYNSCTASGEFRRQGSWATHRASAPPRWSRSGWPVRIQTRTQTHQIARAENLREETQATRQSGEGDLLHCSHPEARQQQQNQRAYRHRSHAELHHVLELFGVRAPRARAARTGE
jgi:hypothetical protein